VYLADAAVPSSIPVKPRKQLNTLLGLLLGLMTGVGLALFMDARDKTIRGPGDLERYLPSVSLLGTMPLLPRATSANTSPLLTDQSSLALAENVRTIRTNVLLSSPNDLPASVLITSPGENEGKTTLAESLAIAMAQLENTRVLLIDVDLRKPGHNHIHGVQLQRRNARGLVDFLEGRAELEEIVQQTEIANLSVIPRGKRTSNPSELIHSKQMNQLLNWCRQEGFHVLLDAPPVLPVTDAAILASRVDGVLLVACAGQTPRLACQLALQRLTVAGGKILGIVLQKAEVQTNPYYCYVSDQPNSSSDTA
jgi:polysaccharide biosynthesis transport protein